MVLFRPPSSFACQRYQAYVGRALACEYGPRHETVAQFALPLRKGVRAFPVERKLVVVGVMDRLVGVAEMDWDRRAFRLLNVGKLRQFTPTLGRSTRQTFGVRGAGVCRHVPHVRLVADMFLPDA